MRLLCAHVIITAYGSWLPNDPRGSWSDFVGAWELLRFGTATKVDVTVAASATARVPIELSIYVDARVVAANNLAMAMFLESQLGLFEREELGHDVPEVEDLIAFHLTALDRLEAHLGRGGLSEIDRPLVPLFRRWLAAAGNVKEIAKNLRNAGQSVTGYDDLLRAMNRSKPIAESFDYFVQLNCSLAATEKSSKSG